MIPNQSQEFDLLQTPGYRIGRTFLRLKNGLRKAFLAQGIDVTPDQWAVLALCGHVQGLSQSELGERLFKDKASITRILDRLEGKHLLVRLPDDQDRRSFRIHLTDQGMILRQRLIPISRAYAAHCYSRLSEEEMAGLAATLDKINQTIDLPPL